MALTSTGFFELDELAHFMKSRDSWSNARNLLDIWARPLCTLYFALMAPFGVAASRCLAVALTSLTALGTVRVAARFMDEQPHRRALIWLLLFAQPMFLLQSFAVMTEMMLACLWVWALALLSRGRIEAAGLLIGLGGLARPEGLLAILCWPCFLAATRAVARRSSSPRDEAGGIPDADENSRWSRHAWIISVGLSILPCLLWWLAGWQVYGSASWFVTQWPWGAHSRYGRTALKFLLSSLVALGFWMIVPLALGIRDCWERSRAGLQARLALLHLVVPLAAVAGLHACLGALGLFGSLSLPRYFVVVSPMIAILSAQGLYAGRKGKPLRWGLIAALSLAPMTLLLLAGQLPIPTNTQFRLLTDATAYAEQQAAREGKDRATIVAAHPYLYYRLNLSLDAEGHRRLFTTGGLQSAPVGTVVVAENIIWEFDGFPAQAQLESWGYRLLKTWSGPGKEKRTLPGFSLLMNQHLLSLVGDAARVQVWVKER